MPAGADWGAAQWAAVLWALAVIATDVARRRIPNLLSLGAVGVGMLYLGVAGQGLLGAGWLEVLLGAALSMLLTLPGYLVRQLGGGDVKLLLAIGVLGGWQGVLASFAAAGLMAGAVIAIRLALSHTAGYPVPKGRWLPFGAALAAGFMLAIGWKHYGMDAIAF